MKSSYLSLFAAALSVSSVFLTSYASAQSDTDVFYCPGESKQFIGPDGKFIQVNRQTYESWPRAKQDAYRTALDKHIQRTDASARAFNQAAFYARDNALELHRKRLEYLNSDPNLFPFREGEVDLLLKGESQMTGNERKAFEKTVFDADGQIMRKLAQSSFNKEFCTKRR
jgi:hypothetical protein